MTLGIFLDSEAYLGHNAHYQQVTDHCHHSGRSGRSHPKRTHLGRITRRETDVGSLAERTVRIARDDDEWQFTI